MWSSIIPTNMNACASVHLIIQFLLKNFLFKYSIICFKIDQLCDNLLYQYLPVLILTGHLSSKNLCALSAKPYIINKQYDLESHEKMSTPFSVQCYVYLRKKWNLINTYIPKCACDLFDIAQSVNKKKEYRNVSVSAMRKYTVFYLLLFVIVFICFDPVKVNIHCCNSHYIVTCTDNISNV